MKRRSNNFPWAVVKVTSLGAIVVLALVIVSSCDSPPTKPVRISFLAQGEALRDTLSLLNEVGISSVVTNSFSRLVEHYFASEFEFDFSKFPKPQHGFYCFANATNLLAALPYTPCEAGHGYGVNCFDNVVLLAGADVKLDLRPDQVTRSFIVSSYTNIEALCVADTARAAFEQLYTPEYREWIKDIVPGSLHDARIMLTSSLFCWHKLPASCTEKTLQQDVMNTLRNSWRPLGLRFPQQMEIVLCHSVNLPEQNLATDHAGLLIHRPSGYTYIEKAGIAGPFVRFDFDNRADLLLWLSNTYGGPHIDYTYFFASFNDTQIEQLKPSKHAVIATSGKPH